MGMIIPSPIIAVATATNKLIKVRCLLIVALSPENAAYSLPNGYLSRRKVQGNRRGYGQLRMPFAASGGACFYGCFAGVGSALILGSPVPLEFMSRIGAACPVAIGRTPCLKTGHLSSFRNRQLAPSGAAARGGAIALPLVFCGPERSPAVECSFASLNLKGVPFVSLS